MKKWNFFNKSDNETESQIDKEIGEEDQTLSHFFNYSSLPIEFQDRKIFITEWLKFDGDLIKKGDRLFELEIRGQYGGINQASVTAQYDGILEIIKKASTDIVHTEYLSEGEKVFILHKYPSAEKISELKNKRADNVPLITTDNFTGTKEIKWSKVAGQQRARYYDGGMHDCIRLISNDSSRALLLFTLNNLEGKDYIVFRYLTKDFKLTIGSKILFRFDNGETIQFVLFDKPYKYSQYSSWGNVFETRSQMTQNDLDHLKSKELSNWKIVFSQTNKSIAGTIDSSDIKFSINKLTIDYCNIVNLELPDYKPLYDKPILNISKENSEECYIYLMIDIKNNYHKIGISNKPEIREKTLQSEKPTIELITSKKFPNRKIASSFEQALHQAYAHKRIRGEWFELSGKDIDDLKAIFG